MIAICRYPGCDDVVALKRKGNGHSKHCSKHLKYFAQQNRMSRKRKRPMQQVTISRPFTTLKALRTRIRIRKLRESLAVWRTAARPRRECNARLKRWVWDRWRYLVLRKAKSKRRELMSRAFNLWKNPEFYHYFKNQLGQPSCSLLPLDPGSLNRTQDMVRLRVDAEEAEYLQRVNANRARFNLPTLLPMKW